MKFFMSIPYEQVNAFISELESTKQEVVECLLKIESFETIEDEIFKTIDALRNIDIEKEYLSSQTVNSVSAFLPLNLPLYSSVIFGVIPSFLSAAVYVRPPTLLKKTVTELDNILKFNRFFHNLHILFLERDKFMSDYVKKSDVVIFTGKLENADKICKRLKENAIFLYNGRGINPLIVGRNADVDLAVKKTVDVKLFNNGQDCAGSDCIFVHNSLSNEFIQKIKELLSLVKIGDYFDRDVRVGSLVEADQIMITSQFIQKHREKIIYGGQVDFSRQIVMPTVIYYPNYGSTNHAELFSPVFLIVEYNTEEQIASYFESANYQQYAMYVSLFGECEYIENQCHSITLRNKIIHEVERGNKEFGGHSRGASFVRIGKYSKSQPILISREISTSKRLQMSLKENPHLIVEEKKGGPKVFRVRGTVPGYKLLVLGAVHGNEICGTYAIHRLLHKIELKTIRIETGELIFVPIANPYANNIFPHHVNPEKKEEQFANQLVELIHECDYLIDLRAFPSEGRPFAFEVFSDRKNKNFIESLGIQKVVVDIQREQNSFEPAQCAREFGKVSAVIECGQNTDPLSANVAYTAIFNGLKYLKMIGVPSKKTEYIQKYQVYQTVIRPEGYRFVNAWKTFDPINIDQVIAANDSTSKVLTASQDSVILMPYDEAEVGAEWYFLAKEMK